jgi:hypothetical protein
MLRMTIDAGKVEVSDTELKFDVSLRHFSDGKEGILCPFEINLNLW